MSEPQGTPSRKERLEEVRQWLRDPELRLHDDCYIATACGVSPGLVAAERNRRIQPCADYIYFMRIGLNGPIKIGLSENPESRRGKLQTALPWRIRLLGTQPGQTARNETELHQRFYHLRLMGEWFNPADELLEYVRRYSIAYDESEEPYFSSRFNPSPCVDVTDKGERDPREMRGYSLPPPETRLDEFVEDAVWETKSRGMTKEQLHAMIEEMWQKM